MDKNNHFRKLTIRLVILAMTLSMSMAFATCNSHATEWGGWSEWQDAQVVGSSTRQVEARQVIDSYNMETWVYTDQSSPNLRGYWPNSTGNTLRAHYTETWPKSLIDSPWRVINANTFYDSPDNDNCDGQIHDAKAYVVVDGQGHSYVPFFIKGTNYKTQYRYRDQIIENVDISSAVIKSKTDQDSNTIASNGNSVEDNITVSLDGKTLIKNKDYTVSYDNTVTVGKVKVTVSGIGGYIGSCSKSFILLPPKTDVKNITVDNNQIIIYWDKNANVTGYEVQVSRNSNFTDCTSFTIKKNTTTKYTVSHLAETGTYYVRIRSCYHQGKTDCYSDWSPVKTVYVVVKEGSSYDLSLAKVNPIPDKKYTGKAIKPNPTIVNGTYVLVKGQDYTVKYKNNVNIGTATVTMTGKGRYYGTAKTTFRIVPKATKLSKLTAKSQGFKATWKKVGTCHGYLVCYSTNSSFINAQTKVVNGKSKTSVTVSGLAGTTGYHVRVCAFYKTDGQRYESAWSKVSTVTTKVAPAPDSSGQSGKFYRTIGAMLYGEDVNPYHDYYPTQTKIGSRYYGITYNDRKNPLQATIWYKKKPSGKKHTIIVVKRMGYEKVVTNGSKFFYTKYAWKKGKMQTCLYQKTLGGKNKLLYKTSWSKSSLSWMPMTLDGTNLYYGQYIDFGKSKLMKMDLKTGKTTTVVKNFRPVQGYGKYILGIGDNTSLKDSLIDSTRHLYNIETGQMLTLPVTYATSYLAPTGIYNYEFGSEMTTNQLFLTRCDYNGSNKVTLLQGYGVGWMTDTKARVGKWINDDEYKSYDYVYATGQLQPIVWKPGKVKIKKAAVSGKKVRLTWTSAYNAEKYQVMARKASKKSKWSKVAETSERSYTYTGKYNTKYKFKVRAVNQNKYGKYSSVKTVRTKKAASKTKKMTVYDKVIKSGSVVYCSSTKGISKVNLKTGKVTLLKDVKDYGYSGFNKMKKKGKYLYYVFDTGSAAYMGIYRTNLKTGKNEKILQSYEGEPFGELLYYAIRGKKLIASGYDFNDKRLNLVMKLNGKNKKKTTRVKAKNKVKKTNKKGYKIVEKGDIYEGETTYCYLKTPSGKKYYLGKAKPQY